MDIETFKRLDTESRARRPKPFLLVPPDRIATEAELDAVERAIGIRLPSSYRQFLALFGGGSYGLSNVCSADSESDYYLPRKQAEASAYLPPNLLIASDDFAGGAYVWVVEDGKAAERICYWHRDGGLTPTQFENVLDFLGKFAYEAA